MFELTVLYYYYYYLIHLYVCLYQTEDHINSLSSFNSV